jgi:lantibiotic modifying enzyme
MSGHAGVALGLLVLASLLQDDSLLACAATRADALLKAAQRTQSGLSWRSPNLPDTPGLTGYSHGAAGIAVALLEMAFATGDSRYRTAATEAFDYERSLFDPVARNWPDLRQLTGVSPGPPAFATFWCHGAPGCALARLRAIDLDGDPRLEVEALTALATTATWVRAGLSSGLNYSLCHGLGGNAEILSEGAPLTSEHAALAEEVAVSGADTYGGGDRRWPCGAHGGTTAGLFLGLAGIGRFYLRLARPELPSLLLIRPPTPRKG